MKIKSIYVLAISFIFLSGAANARPAFLDRRPEQEQRQEILTNSAGVLSRLYAAQPQAKAAVEKAYGYATFSNFGVKIFFAGSGTGRGVAVNNKTMQRTFMNMAEVQAGLGLGVKKFMLIWVFENPQTFDRFVNSGWELGAQASAAAKAGERGGSLQGAIEISPGVYVYQLTEAGLAVELTAKGTKYYKDKDLNSNG